MNFATTSSVYSVAPNGTVLYPGFSGQTITSARVVACIDTDTSGYTFDVRLVDSSHSDSVLAAVTGLSGSAKAIYSLGAISNVPTSDAMLEVQVRRSGTTSGTERAAIYALLLEYA